jgi:hypothetical protein
VTPKERTDRYWPDFIIGGAPKCGTTALFSYLGQHPGVFVSDPKEPHYFASAALQRPVMKGHCATEEYRALFAGRKPGQLAGEGSTHYLHHAEAVAPLMAAEIPDVRLVFCLRDPIGRAYSHYLFRYSCAGPYTLGGVGSNVSFEEFARAPEMLAMGDYASNLAVFDHYFGRDRIMVVLLDDLREGLNSVLAGICRHIGVDDQFTFDLSYRSNETEYVRWPWAMPLVDPLAAMAYRRAPSSQREALIERRRRWFFAGEGQKPRMPTGARAALLPHYEASIAATEERLGRDLSAWRKL